MKDFADMHEAWCQCDQCQPYVPADKANARYTRRFEVAAVMAIVFLVTLWIMSR